MPRTFTRKRRDRLRKEIAQAVADGDTLTEQQLRLQLADIEGHPTKGDYETEGEAYAKSLYGGRKWGL